MDTEIFEVIGQVTSKRGFAIHNLRVAVVDQDMMFHDLIGVGFTDKNGEFQLSFTRSEFNQDAFENEEVPDLMLICSVWDDDRFKVVHQHTCGELAFKDGSEDLGTVVIDSWDEAPRFIEGADPSPGLTKRVARLDITEPLVSHCLAEVAPLVEELTGWPDLLADLKVDITDDISPYFRKLTEEVLGESTWVSRQLDRLLAWSSSVMALYDPTSHTIAINRSRMARYTNLDGFKVILGHELVHVGQFKQHPELIKLYRAQLDWIRELLEESEELDVAAVQEAVGRSEFQARMSELEGYAYYIQRDYLERRYHMATWFEHASLFEGLFQGAIKFLVPGMQGGNDLKLTQYESGSQAYRSLRGGGEDKPVPFSIGIM